MHEDGLTNQQWSAGDKLAESLLTNDNGELPPGDLRAMIAEHLTNFEQHSAGVLVEFVRHVERQAVHIFDPYKHREDLDHLSNPRVADHGGLDLRAYHRLPFLI